MQPAFFTLNGPALWLLHHLTIALHCTHASHVEVAARRSPTSLRGPVVRKGIPMPKLIYQALWFSCLLLCCFVCGCSDQEAQRRESTCKNLGVTEEIDLKACRRSVEEKNRVIRPLLEVRRKNDLIRYNDQVPKFNALPLEREEDRRYVEMTIEEMNRQHHCCSLKFINDSEAKNHALYGKRFVVEGVLKWWPRDQGADERFSLEERDRSDAKNTWVIDADIESLPRNQRNFLRSNCNAFFSECKARAFGIIGVLDRRISEETGILGMQIERVQLLPIPTTS